MSTALLSHSLSDVLMPLSCHSSRCYRRATTCAAAWCLTLAGGRGDSMLFSHQGVAVWSQCSESVILVALRKGSKRSILQRGEHSG